MTLIACLIFYGAYQLWFAAFVLTAVLCLFTTALGAAAAEVDCTEVYCFRAGDFSREEDLKGICLTGLPEGSIGTLMLGTRILRPGDILTAGQVEQMTFHPVRTQTPRSAEVSYLPIYENTVAAAAAMTLEVLGREDKAPVRSIVTVSPTVRRVRSVTPSSQVS